jgi:flagellar biosynthesis protein FlhG
MPYDAKPQTGITPYAEVKLSRPADTTRRSCRQPVQVIAIAGGKGGTGKTAIAINLSMALAQGGRHVLLLDADLGMANIDTLLGLDARMTLGDVLNAGCRLEEILLHVNDRLVIVPAASGILQLANPGPAECAGLVRAFSELEWPVNTLIIDTASGISESIGSFCRAAAEVLVVTCNEPASIRDSVSQIRMLSSEYGIVRYRILANRVSTAQEGRDLFSSILERIGDQNEVVCSYAGFVPEDEHLRSAGLQHRTVIEAFPRSRSAMALSQLAGRILAWPCPTGPGGHLEFFVERLIDKENIDMEVTP